MGLRPRSPATAAGVLGVGAVVALASVGAATFARGGGHGPSDEVDAAGPPPALPVIPSEFDGVTLATRLMPLSLRAEEMDAFLASSVLRDAEFTRAVHWWVTYWTVYATRWFPGFLDRMALRGDEVDAALAVRAFPPSLRYLPLIESGYDPRVTSRSGAAGMWQLMPSTARGLGLTVTSVMDERRDVERSTDAALRYLDSLHAEFGSWFVVLAAYNSGPTRMRSILRRHAPGLPPTDSLFWALRDHFPIETREFVPKLYGAMFVASQPEAYGYESVDGELYVLRTARVVEP